MLFIFFSILCFLLFCIFFIHFDLSDKAIRSSLCSKFRKEGKKKKNVLNRVMFFWRNLDLNNPLFRFSSLPSEEIVPASITKYMCSLTISRPACHKFCILLAARATKHHAALIICTGYKIHLQVDCIHGSPIIWLSFAFDLWETRLSLVRCYRICVFICCGPLRNAAPSRGSRCAWIEPRGVAKTELNRMCLIFDWHIFLLFIIMQSWRVLEAKLWCYFLGSHQYM